MTVGQLAEQQGISLKEAIALCVVSGVQVTGADTTLTPADVARVHDVLEGRVNLPDPRTTASKKKLGARSNRVNPVGPFLTIGAIVLLLGGCLLGSLVLLRKGDTRVLRAAPGDCFDAELVGFVVLPSSVQVVPCSGPHKYRAFGTIDLDEVFKSWPGSDKITSYAQDRCPTLAGAAGLPRARILYVGPGNQELWDDPSTTHKIVCAAPQKDWDRRGA